MEQWRPYLMEAIMPIVQRNSLILAATCLLAVASASVASPPEHRPGSAAQDRWEETMAAFAAADLEDAPLAGSVLFVGSSSIRLWSTLENQFGAAQVLKRGFGGSRLTDCVKHLDRLVVQYQPRVVLLYAGDNDLAEGGSPDDVLARFKAFTEGVHGRLPDTRIVFISIKPSPARRALIGKARAANELVRAYADEHPRVDYVDVFTPMLAADGMPRAELFRKDALHLNDDGYALWGEIIRPFVR
jgi:lysophospholipase L1-like esterase